MHQHLFERGRSIPLLRIAPRGAVTTALQGSFNLTSGRALIIHGQRKPVLAELFPLSFSGIPGDLMTTPRAQAQFVTVRECGSNHC